MFNTKPANGSKTKGQKRKKRGRDKRQKVVISQSFIKRIMPFGNIQFKSDYFKTGLFYGAVLTFITDPGSVYGLPPMWGPKLIPVTDDKKVTARLIVAFQTRDKAWVKARSVDATQVADGAFEDAANAHQGLDMSSAQRRQMDNEESLAEINAGASYLDVTYRIVLYAPTRTLLENSIAALSQSYASEFGTARLTQFVGQQQYDYTNLLGPAQKQLGLHDGFTSTEFMGFYPFVSHGWIDPHGDCIGQTAGDINRSPVIWDAESIKRIALVGSDDRAKLVGNDPMASSAQATWLKVISQYGLLNGHKIYNLVLNDEDITKIGTDLPVSSIKMDMNTGLINPLQGFGDRSDDLQLFNITIAKICSMAKQLNSEMDDDTITLLRQTLNEFYISEDLWVDDPQHHREDLRFVGLKNYADFPVIKRFVMFLSAKYRHAAKGTNTSSSNPIMAKQYMTLFNMFDAMESQYGYLFDTVTKIDEARLDEKPMKIFEFGRLHQSGGDVLMAQFLNVFAFIISKVQDGDIINIYAGELLSPLAWDYLNRQLYYLNRHNIKLVIGFNRVSDMINSPVFSEADTVLTGQMTSATVEAYSDAIHSVLPTALIEQISNSQDSSIYYLRRGNQNVTFYWDMVF